MGSEDDMIIIGLLRSSLVNTSVLQTVLTCNIEQTHLKEPIFSHLNVERLQIFMQPTVVIGHLRCEKVIPITKER